MHFIPPGGLELNASEGGNSREGFVDDYRQLGW